MNTVNYDCRPGDVIQADWNGTGKPSNARVVNTFATWVEVEPTNHDRIRDGECDLHRWGYNELRNLGAVYVAKLIPVGPDGRLLGG